MKIQRILTNNAVVTLNQKGAEQIVCGKGIAFKKKIGDDIDDLLIDKTFILLRTNSLQAQLEQLLSDIPMEYVELARDIVDMAMHTMNVPLSDSLIISLSDHLYETVRRIQKGFPVSNGLSWEIRRFYEKEYEAGLLALYMVEKTLGLELPTEEAACIAMHIVNARADSSTMEETFRRTRLIGDITRIVRIFFGRDFDESSCYYYRFITHLNHFVLRVLRGEPSREQINHDLIRIVFETYRSAWECAEKIGDFLAGKLDYHISDEEKMYITIHIHLAAGKPSRACHEAYHHARVTGGCAEHI